MSALSEFELDYARTALLVVDMQNDFCKPEGFFAGAGHDVSTCQGAVDRTRVLLEQVRPYGLPVFWSRSINPDEPQYTLPPLRFRAPRESEEFEQSVGGTNAFDPGSWGSQIVDDLRVAPEDVVIDKPTYNFFYKTPLEEELRARGIANVIVTGVTTNCCVDSTTREAFIRDFGVLILSDCVAAFGNERALHDASLHNLSLLFAVVAEADDLVEDLRERAPEPAGV
jgi:ureidoacrylate peracid hydrolase